MAELLSSSLQGTCVCGSKEEVEEGVLEFPKAGPVTGSTVRGETLTQDGEFEGNRGNPDMEKDEKGPSDGEQGESGTFGATVKQTVGWIRAFMSRTHTQKTLEVPFNKRHEHSENHSNKGK